MQLVSPGAWLCDLTLERYEVREKKISKKVRFAITCYPNANHFIFVVIVSIICKQFISFQCKSYDVNYAETKRAKGYGERDGVGFRIIFINNKN